MEKICNEVSGAQAKKGGKSSNQQSGAQAVGGEDWLFVFMHESHKQADFKQNADGKHSSWIRICFKKISETKKTNRKSNVP